MKKQNIKIELYWNKLRFATKSTNFESEHLMPNAIQESFTILRKGTENQKERISKYLDQYGNLDVKIYFNGTLFVKSGSPDSRTKKKSNEIPLMIQYLSDMMVDNIRKFVMMNKLAGEIVDDLDKIRDELKKNPKMAEELQKEFTKYFQRRFKN